MKYLKRAIWIARFVMGAQLFSFFCFFTFLEQKIFRPDGSERAAVIGLCIIVIILFVEIGLLFVRTRSLKTQGMELKLLAKAGIFLFDAMTLVLGTITAFSILYVICPVVGLEEITGRQALYFSMVTFTTLGYGDLTPSEGFQLIAASEALLGFLVFGLIVGYASSLFSEKKGW